MNEKLKQKTIFIVLFMFISILAIIPLFYTDEPPAQAVSTSVDLSEEINEFIENEPILDGALAGISIRSADHGKLLYEHNGEIRMQPASILKMFTAAASLSVLGEDYRFTTEVLTTGKIAGGTLSGDLYLKGKGDPTLLPADFAEIAKKLKKNGISKIDGDIITDDSWYDDVRYSEDLSWNDEHQYYGAQISALTASPNLDYDAGTVIVSISPGKKGKAAKISLEPDTDFVTVVNETKTIEPKGKQDIQIKREHGTNAIVVKGSIPADSQLVREWVAVWNPAQYAGTLFKKALEDQGIEIVGKIKNGKAADAMPVLIFHKSIPLADLMIPFMKLSNNGHAEVLVKEIGKAVHGDGSWDKGFEGMMDELESIGVDTSKIILRDGSGLSHANLVPANEITKILYEVQGEEWFPVFKNSLPVAGAKDRMVGGTMRNRLKEEAKFVTVQAKTGSLTGVSTLAGYVEKPGGETLIFTIMLNNLLDDRDGRNVEDQIVRILSRQ
ncbi:MULTISPECIES: D-alanyl-D-alanine carboxypeptidase/D-alanyl-D-alanine-endopeptidase [unclassified Mesobacillus]|uniref:D-alanyl-D-alanine carboxypeptidase/D-alanyl-D-alanine endopeptidase n=1 Tax=unclassified Mesobacillus TaxID=2675270 RepID=UPI00203AF51C|nr:MULTISPECIES: D-alanyl-D-alanine carboxypeptidase/D-alanyl-D-alanine-endopeptidase [unclassified Mesobacillus]MCM3125075.1 D-alanyl-D-alanine carboxypeptidase/D-alanyl-D-alanine-endopeptidase [Mesobacillus sp. MER 33]MCM3235165.1 D-alanyl-D-alanine carboxypeptidase/D-alanyl-D-alanine-endopeptidase [Mesobacillus sp. MER 48]